MKLYNVPRNSKIMLSDGVVLLFHHIDGMYSVCTDENGDIYHISASEEVTVMTKDEALKLALEALEAAEIDGNCEYGATEIIRKALAQPAQEPVAYWNVNGGFSHCMIDKLDEAAKHNPAPLFTSPPQRPWVELTDKEIWETISRIGTSDSDVNPYAKLLDARAIEAKLKQKNGYAKEKNT